MLASLTNYNFSAISGNIFVSNGSCKKFNKLAVPPNVMCAKHQVWHEYTPPGYQAHKSHCENGCNHLDQIALT